MSSPPKWTPGLVRVLCPLDVPPQAGPRTAPLRATLLAMQVQMWYPQWQLFDLTA